MEAQVKTAGLKIYRRHFCLQFFFLKKRKKEGGKKKAIRQNNREDYRVEQPLKKREGKVNVDICMSASLSKRKETDKEQ